MAVTLALVLLCASATVEAQPPPEARRVGYLHADLGGLPSGFYEVLREGLRDLGYVEGRNLTKTVPIVFSYSGDPVEAGFVTTLARPGGNMTGITWLAFDLVGKRLELLKEAAPRMSRIAVLANPAHPGEQRELAETTQTARAVGVTVQYHQVGTTADFHAVFDTIVRDRADAVVVLPDGVTIAHRRHVAEFAVKHRLPSVFGWREYVEVGGLMAYGPNRRETARRLVVYVDKILKGARPADLPVEQPATFEFVINLKTAKALGLDVPPSLLLRADQVIE